MRPVEIRRMVNLRGQCSYNEANKAEFKRLSKKFLREVAKMLCMAPTAVVHYNNGGIAGSGDATLHSENLYISFNAETFHGIMYRSCKGLNDYSGGPNQWLSWEDVYEKKVEGFAEILQRFLTRQKQAA